MVTHSEAPRTGAVGRLVRVVWFGAAAYGIYALVGELANPSSPDVLGDPGFWIITVISVFVASQSAPLLGRGRPERLLIATAVAAVVAGAVGLAVTGQIWAAPLGWLIWTFDLLAYASVGLAFALAVVLGTPGCEYGAYQHLRARLRGEEGAATTAHSCAAGLDRLDRWEAQRREARA